MTGGKASHVLPDRVHPAGLLKDMDSAIASGTLPPKMPKAP